MQLSFNAHGRNGQFLQQVWEVSNLKFTPESRVLAGKRESQTLVVVFGLTLHWSGFTMQLKQDAVHGESTRSACLAMWSKLDLH